MSESLLAVPAKDVAGCSLKDHERLRRDRRVARTVELDDATLGAILSAEIPAEADRLNVLLADPRAAPPDAADRW